MYEDGQGVERYPSEAENWYRKAAIQGDAYAQYRQGLEEEYNEHYIKALDLYEKSANQGNDESQYRIGEMYYKGKGVRQDYSKAAEWYEKSANQGNAFGQY